MSQVLNSCELAGNGKNMADGENTGIYGTPPIEDFQNIPQFFSSKNDESQISNAIFEKSTAFCEKANFMSL